jgi:hypothetical protein
MVGGAAQLLSLGHNMRSLTVLFIILYWAACCGFYFGAALAFVRVMKLLTSVPKGWIRSSLWVLMITPVRGVVMLFPYFLGLSQIRLRPEPDKLVLFFLSTLCFAASLIPATMYWRRQRDIVYGVIRQ